MSESSSNSPKGRPRLRRVFVWALLGIFAVQVAWVFTVPPFRGLDEHDHSYKVAAVARGDWSPRHEVSPDGWGEFVVVPAALVEAASPVCEALPYTTSDNCSAGPSHGGGLVEVAHSAARYNPAFYALVGIPARWADGADSLYAMRLTAVFLCALLIAGAVTVLRSWAETDAPLVGLLLALTPTMVYTTSVGAPNGIEVAAAALVWCALLGVVKRRHDPAAVATYLAVATVGAIPLVTVRTLGPLWLVLIVASVAVLLGRDAWTVARTKAFLRSAIVVTVFATAAMAWTLVASTNSLGGPNRDFERSLSSSSRPRRRFG